MTNLGKKYDMSFSRNEPNIRERLLQYAAQYGPITVRGLYYAVLAAGLIDKSEDNSKKLGRLVTKLRRDGILPWESVVDGSRSVHAPPMYPSIRDGVGEMLDYIRIDPWATKRHTVIVLIEKDALTGVIEPTTRHYGVPLWPVRGYSSLTVLREIAERIFNDGRPCFVYQLGDLDPSGDHATEEAREEIIGFLAEFESKTRRRAPRVVFERLAINPGQLNTMMIGEGVDARRLFDFGRETSRKDPRYGGYVAKYGAGFPSFELDIIPPPVLRQIVQDAIRRHISDAEIEAGNRRARRQARDITRTLGL
jgi:hypothetical protein